MSTDVRTRRKGQSALSQSVLRRMLLLTIASGFALLPGLAGQAQTAPDGGQIVTPPSGIEKPGDVGKRAHTNVEIFVPNGGSAPPNSAATPGGPQGTNGGKSPDSSPQK